MFRYLICLCLLGSSLLFGAPPTNPTNSTPPNESVTQEQDGGMPPRKDILNSDTPFTQVRLQRAERILSTLVSDPQNYHLILSRQTAFGGEAVPPFVFSDKPTMIVYQGALSPNRSNEEIAFMMAHELGHLNLHHMEKTNHEMEQIFNGPAIGISGTTFSIFHQKMMEREADMFGLFLYNKAGYSVAFFPHTLHLLRINPNIHYGTQRIFGKERSSLSMNDSHFSMTERFELLVAEAQSIV